MPLWYTPPSFLCCTTKQLSCWPLKTCQIIYSRSSSKILNRANKLPKINRIGKSWFLFPLIIQWSWAVVIDGCYKTIWYKVDVELYDEYWQYLNLHINLSINGSRIKFLMWFSRSTTYERFLPVKIELSIIRLLNQITNLQEILEIEKKIKQHQEGK